MEEEHLHNIDAESLLTTSLRSLRLLCHLFCLCRCCHSPSPAAAVDCRCDSCQLPAAAVVAAADCCCYGCLQLSASAGQRRPSCRRNGQPLQLPPAASGSILRGSALAVAVGSRRSRLSVSSAAACAAPLRGALSAAAAGSGGPWPGWPSRCPRG